VNRPWDTVACHAVILVTLSTGQRWVKLCTVFFGSTVSSSLFNTGSVPVQTRPTRIFENAGPSFLAT